MLKLTNLEQVKEVCKILFLSVPIKPLIAGICSHPFTNSIIVPNMTSKNIENYLDLTKKDDYKKWKESTFKRIDNFNNAESIFYFTNKPYRLTLFKYCNEYLNLHDFSEILKYCWITSENPNDDINVSINELIRYFRKADKHILMNEEEYKIWEELPDKFIIYRGISNHHNPKGLSWTENKNVAEWFMNRWKNPDNYLLQATVKKEDCLCYFNERNEDEIVVDSRHIKSKRID